VKIRPEPFLSPVDVDGLGRIVPLNGLHPVRESRKLFGIIFYRLQGELV